MKIIVNNEDEKNLIESLLTALDNGGLEALEEDYVDYEIDSDGEGFLEQAVRDSSIVVNQEEPEIPYYDDGYNFSAPCSKCKGDTLLFSEGEEITYAVVIKRRIAGVTCERCWCEDGE